MKNCRLLLLVYFVLSAVSVTMYGQYVSPTAGDLGVIPATSFSLNTYGTSSQTSYTMADWNFTPLTAPTSYSWSGGKYLTAGGSMQSGPILPAGASVIAIELEACDSSATGQVSGYFGYCPSPGPGACNIIQQFSTGSTFAGGCGYYSTTLATPHTVDNRNQRYIVEWTNTPGDGTTTFRAFRIYYKLQVTPDNPGQQTFFDVPPGHIFHRWIEALYASGITAGCASAPLRYCPDANVTRGEMAVFLSAALGLHWAP